MSILSAVSALFSPKDIAETAKSAVRGLDDIVYTEQEKAEKTQFGQELYAKLWSAAVPSAVSRRLIAATITGVWAFLIVFAVVAYAVAAGVAAYMGTATNGEVSLFTLDVLKEVVLQPMNIVVGFYFLKEIVTEYRKKEK